MFQLKHITSSSDLTKDAYDELFRRAEQFTQQGIPRDLCKGKVAATLFFQPSTRTMMSFQSAMLRSGGGWIGVSGKQGISMEKGEDWEDTVRTFSDYADIIVMRHPDSDSADIAAKVSRVPVVNGGSGDKEHAVSAAMMLFSIYHYVGKLEGVKVGLYGTPGITRVCKSIIPVMGHYGMRLIVDDLGHFPVLPEIEEQAKKNGLAELTYDALDNFIGDVDILILTHGLQKGIIPEDKFPKEKTEMILKKYKPITMEHMKKLRQDAYIDMVLPRTFEIDKTVDADPRAIYSKKSLYTEIALAAITYLLGIKT